MTIIQENKIAFLQENVSDGGFLQSEEWWRFQETAGHRTFHFAGENFWANVIEHELLLVGKYWYVPRGPVVQFPISNFQFPNKSKISNSHFQNIQASLQQLIEEAKRNKVGWIRIEPASDDTLWWLRENVPYTIVKTPHDMQPREILVMDIKTELEVLLAQMKPKTRYNIRLAQKKGVKVFATREKKYSDIFSDLVEITAQRDRITPHSRNYYQQMFETLPQEMLQCYVAEHEGDVLAANLVVFFGRHAMYLHGASSDIKRSLMAPYMLQWQQILDAKKRGHTRYDLGGVKTMNSEQKTKNSEEKTDGSDNTWEGITRFKRGFAPNTKPTVFPGSYDILLNRGSYMFYRAGQKMQATIKKCLKKLTK